MPTIGVRDLQRNPGRVLDELKRTGRPAFVTRRGQPEAVLLPVDAAALEDYVLANAPEPRIPPRAREHQWVGRLP